MKKHVCSLVLTLVFLSGCSAAPTYMIPAPAIYHNPSIDLYSKRSISERTTEVPVFYATTRKPALETAAYYEDKPGSGEVLLGKANVQLGEPGWTFDDLVKSDQIDTYNNPRPAKVSSVQQFGEYQQGNATEQKFIDSINTRLSKTENKNISL